MYCVKLGSKAGGFDTDVEAWTATIEGLELGFDPFGGHSDWHNWL